MRFAATSLLLLCLLGAVAASADPRPRAWAPPDASRSEGAAAVEHDDDPDAPSSLRGSMDKGEYLRLRGNYYEERNDAPFDVAFQGRMKAIQTLKRQAGEQGPFSVAGSWTPIGPFPIPNGQTTTISTPVSGRVVAIAVHPTNPDLVYVGAAQGGVYRSTNGGATWTPIFDAAASLAVSSLALAPSNPSILYVGTGESSGSCDSYFGVGLYRIDNADTAPVLNGPFNPPVTTGIAGTTAFTGRAISTIAVHPTNPDIIFVGTTAGIGGIGCDQLAATVPPLALRGLYRSFNATSGAPSFEKIRVSGDGSVAPDLSGNRNTFDVKLDPNNPDKLVCWYSGATGAGNGGVFVTNNALAPVPTFTNTFASPTSFIRGEIAVTTQGAVTKWMIATGEVSTGRIRRSYDANTWSATLGGAGYCGGQCFYDICIAMPPGDTATVLLGGAAGTGIMQRSVNGGATFAQAATGLHADSHALTFAPSNPAVVYTGSDGGVWRSADGGATWTSRNTTGLSTTQFQSIATHPIDPNFTIGGTQDNGTNWYKPDGTWIRADFGDGGFTAIDQNATDNTNVTMYHTYFNQTNAMGYARVTNTGSASDGLWTLFGCGFGGSVANGMTCTASAILFYAPIATGPGSPNTLYFGSDVLYRSVNAGVTVTKVSQEPITSGVPITAIGIAPSNDNVRLIGLRNGTVWLTTTGASVLTNVSAGLPAKYVARCTIDPTNANVAYVSFAGFGLPANGHVYKTTNLLSGTPTWTTSGAGIPDVPVNAFVVDPVIPANLYAGTDVGVYRSTDGGASWSPFTTGMPVVAVFDMSLHGPSRNLRIATHGRGMWERLVDAPVATQLALVGSEIEDGRARLMWFSADGAGELVKIYRRAIPGEFVKVADVVIGGDGQVSYEDADIVPGRSYEYEVGVMNGAREQRLGRVWLDVPNGRGLALRRSGASGTLRFAINLPTSEQASLELVDVTGRRVAEQDLGSRPAGETEITLSRGGLRPGVYWARLKQAGKIASVRVALTQS